MSRQTIYQATQFLQDAREGIYTMQGIALTRLLHSVIREYGKSDGDSYSVDLATIGIDDRKLILSHILDSEEYEWATISWRRINAVFDDNADYVQKLIDAETWEVYREDQEEMGLRLCVHPNNDEAFWVRR